MSKIVNSIIDDYIETMSSDTITKDKIEKNMLNPIVHKAYIKCKPYLSLLLYMYSIIIFFLIIIIILIIRTKKS